MTRFKMYGIVPPLPIIAVWHAAASLGLVSPLFVPTPLEVAQTLWMQLAVTGELWGDVFATLYRTLAGFGIATIAGVAIGLCIGYWAKLHSALEFLIDFFRSIPATALFRCSCCSSASATGENRSGCMGVRANNNRQHCVRRAPREQTSHDGSPHDGRARRVPLPQRSAAKRCRTRSQDCASPCSASS